MGAASTGHGTCHGGELMAAETVDVIDKHGIVAAGSGSVDVLRRHGSNMPARVVLSSSIVGLINSATPGMVKTLSNSELSAGIN
jgi:hypothetical protein